MSLTIDIVDASRRVSSIVFAKRVTTVANVKETALPGFCCSVPECSSEEHTAAATAAAAATAVVAEATVGVADLCRMFRN